MYIFLIGNNVGKDAWVGYNHLTPNEVELFSGGAHLDNKVDS